MSTDHLALSMAGILSLGGIIGYAKGSKLSLLFGLGYGAAYGYASYNIRNGEYVKGHNVSLISSVTLAFIMFGRWIKTEKAMPGGVLCLVGIGAAYMEKRSIDRLKALGW